MRPPDRQNVAWIGIIIFYRQGTAGKTPSWIAGKEACNQSCYLLWAPLKLTGSLYIMSDQIKKDQADSNHVTFENRAKKRPQVQCGSTIIWCPIAIRDRRVPSVFWGWRRRVGAGCGDLVVIQGVAAIKQTGWKAVSRFWRLAWATGQPGTVGDTRIVPVPRPRNTLQENLILKDGQISNDWLENGRINRHIQICRRVQESVLGLNTFLHQS